MKRCFGYIRVSTAKQGEGVSLEAQKEAILAFADRHEISICQWFEEKETAAKQGRAIFNGMIRQLNQGKADGLVIHKIDRSARNFSDWAKIGELSDQGIDIHFATEALDFRSRGGRLTADIQAVIAADYIRNLREETIKGIYGRLKQGLYPFCAPIGYLNNGGGKAKTPDPERAPLIRRMYELYATGEYSIRSLHAEMKIQGLHNLQGKPLSLCGIETVLNNPFYTGLIRLKNSGRMFEGVHEPIVSPVLFQRVQDLKLGKYGKKSTKHNHLFRGLFRCGNCNSPMSPEVQKGNVYYRCHTKSCPTKTVREEEIETIIVGTLAQLQISDNDHAKLIEGLECWIKGRKHSEDLEKTLAVQMSQVKNRIERLTDALVDRLIEKDVYNDRMQSLLLDKAAIEEKTISSSKFETNLLHLRKFLELLKNLANTYRIAKSPRKREIVRNAFSNRSIIGRNVYLEPSNWLSMAKNALSVLDGGPEPGTSRTFTIKAAANIEHLLAHCAENSILEECA